MSITTDDLLGENSVKSMMAMDWIPEGDRSHYDIGTGSETYHSMDKLSNPGYIDRAMEALTSSEDIPWVVEDRGESWAEDLYNVAAEQIDENTEEVVFHHENSTRTVEDPSPGEIVLETVNHYDDRDEMSDYFKKGALSEARRKVLMDGGSVEYLF